MNELNSTRKKTILTALAFLAVFIGILLAAEWYIFRIDIREDGQFKAQSIQKTILSYRDESDKLTEWFYDKLRENVRLSVFILQDQAKYAWYTGKIPFEDGILIRIRNGRTVLPPEGEMLFPDLKAEDIMAEYSPKIFTAADGRDMLITSGKVIDGLYYLDWTELDEFQEYYNSQIDVPQLLKYMGNAYGGEIFLLFNNAPGEVDVLGTSETGTFSNIGEFALRQKALGEKSFLLNSETEQYMCYILPLENEAQTAIYCDIVTDEVQTGIHRVITKILFAISFLAAMFIFCFSVHRGIKEGTISETNAAKYTPKKMKQKIFLFSLLSGIALLVITVFTIFVQESHHESGKGLGILDSLELQLSDSDRRAAAAKQTKIDWYQYFGEKIAKIIPEHPMIIEKEKLSGIAQMIKADLIMAFDREGKEIACGLDYIGFNLSDIAADEDTSDLQRLLKGVSVAVRGPEPDYVTGENHYIIGVPYRFPNSEEYGALLFFVDPSVLTGEQDINELSRIYANLASDEELIMEIDPQTFEILSTSGPRLMRSKIHYLDVNSKEYQANKLDVFAHDNVLYFGISRTIREKIWYYAEKISGIVLSALIYSAITSLLFAVICLFIGRNAMNGYTQEFFEECLSANQSAASVPNAGVSADIQNIKDTSYKAELLRRWQQLSPERKTMTFLLIVCGLVVLLLLIAGFLSGNAALAFYVSGSWQKGINPFAVTAIAVIICLGSLLLIIMDLIFIMLRMEMPPREKTIAQLVYSLLRAVVIISLFYNCLTYLGVDTNALLASVGVISLALSLGAKDMVSDTLAGLGIVVGGSFQTGEIVEIGGFKGVVEEIGIRTTKIRSLGSNNIKIINNSEIHNVINYSRELSRFTVNIDFPVLLPIGIVKEYLERELPVIHEEIPLIVNGPFFAGITNLDWNQMTIRVVGQCLEKDVGLVSREMNMKIKERIDRMIDSGNTL